jgi:hypothetical protein
VLAVLKQLILRDITLETIHKMEKEELLKTLDIILKDNKYRYREKVIAHYDNDPTYLKPIVLAVASLAQALINKKEIHNIVKTTRAGATTNMIIAALLLDIKILVVVPTNEIAFRTVREAYEIYEKISGDHSRLVRPIPSNEHGCSKCIQQINENKHLKHLPSQFSPACKNCEIATFELNQPYIKSTATHCAIGSMIEEGGEYNEKKHLHKKEDYQPTILAITYDKLNTLEKLPFEHKPEKSNFFKELVEGTELILFDEFGTYLQKDDISLYLEEKITYKDDKEKNKTTTLEDNLNTAVAEFKKYDEDEEFQNALNEFYVDYGRPFVERVQKTTLKTIEKHREKADKLQELLSGDINEYEDEIKALEKEIKAFGIEPYTITNWAYDRINFDAKFAVDEKKIEKKLKEIAKKRSKALSEKEIESIRKQEIGRQRIDFFNTEKSFTPERLDKLRSILNAKFADIIDSEHSGQCARFILDLANTIMSREFVLEAAYQKTKDLKGYVMRWNIIVPNHYLINDLNLNITNTKGTIITDATMVNFDFRKLYKPVIDHNYGDPLNTNSKMLIAVNREISHFSEDSWFKNENYRTAVVDEMLKVIKAVGIEKVIVYTMSTKMQTEVQKELEAHLGKIPEDIVTYYRNKNARGTSSPVRVQVHLGAAHIPGNAKDAHTYIHRDGFIGYLAPHTLNSIAERHGLTPEKLEKMLKKEFKPNGKLIEPSKPSKEVLKVASETLRDDSVAADTWQAGSRCKDPSSKKNSIMYCIGFTEREAWNIISWGANTVYSNGHRIIGESHINPPICTVVNDFEDASDWLNDRKINLESIGFCDYDTFIDFIENAIPRGYKEKMSLKQIVANAKINLKDRDHNNGYFILAVRAAIKAFGAEGYITPTIKVYDRKSKGIEFYRTNKIPEKYGNADANVDDIFAVGHSVNNRAENRVSINKIHLNIGEERVIKALEAIERFNLLNGSNWRLLRDPRSKTPIIKK